MIEAWVTEPDGTYIAHLERSPSSPFRHFSFFRERARTGPGGGAFEYHPDNALLAAHPTLLDEDNLVWMRYRGRTVTWIIEETEVVLDEKEHETDWRKVSGRGALQLVGDRIVEPPDMLLGNTNPATWATQWRRFSNWHPGEIIWELIDESNPRFTTQITRGTIETDADQWITVDYRFENILDDVIVPLTEAHDHDVEMDGLEFNYHTNPGTDRSDTVIFEEGADLKRLRLTRSGRDRKTRIVGEGVGEGVFAKIATHTSDPEPARRREAFLAAKEAGNVPLLRLMVEGALREHERASAAYAVDVSEDRHRALLDYDLNDTVRVIAPSRGVDAALPIVALYVAEDGDRVRTSFDVGDVRIDIPLDIEEELRKTRSQLGVRNRQPQGQLVPIVAGGSGYWDDDDDYSVLLRLLDEVFIVVRATVTIAIKPFVAPATAASSGGGSTSGASSASSSASGGSSTPTSDSVGAHRHRMFFGIAPIVPLATKEWLAAGDAAGLASVNVRFESDAATELFTQSADGAHSHEVTIGGHTHTIAHTHDIDPHTHGLTYGVFKEPIPSGFSYNLRILTWSGSSWDQVALITALTGEIEEIDVTEHVTGPGLWRFSIDGTDGSPNGGRLGADVSVAVLGAIQSA